MTEYPFLKLCKFLFWFIAIFSVHGTVTAQDLHQLEEQVTQQAVNRVANSIVQIETTGGLDVVEGAQINNGPTTGIVVDREGYVVSSSINFIQQPASIFVRLADGQRVGAEIVAQDHSRKLVLLKLDTTQELIVPQTVQRKDLQVGQTMIAVGKIYDWKTPNVSVGILSATHRIWDKAIQTDAKISPANFGGPLIDLRGRVAGILVPMSQGDNEVISGTEWYDSGIGFAVPMSQFMERVETLKQGKDLKEGRLGISLKGNDIYADKAIVASSRGPAAKAGILAGDEIVMINDRPVSRQAQLKHAIGPLYANDMVSLAVKRGGAKQTFQLELASEIEPFVAPGLGIVLDHIRNPIVKFVIPGSPAADAGIQPGDAIVAVDNKMVETTTVDETSGPMIDQNSLQQIVASLELAKEVTVKIQRSVDEATKEIQLPITPQILTAAPFRIENELNNIAKLTSINVSEFKNKCLAIIPESNTDSPQNKASPCGVVVWVAKPGPVNQKNIETVWKASCADNNCALLVVQSADDKRWQPDESEFIVKTIDLLKKQTRVDETRIVIGGSRSGGVMAVLTAFARRDVFRGLVVVDTQFPSRVSRLETSPTQPLLVFASLSSNPKRAADQQTGIDKLKDAKFPVFESPTGSRLDDLAPRIMRWNQTVNRY